LSSIESEQALETVARETMSEAHRACCTRVAQAQPPGVAAKPYGIDSETPINKRLERRTDSDE